jgi:ligand-binding sensor domain-containing protein
MKTQLFHHIKKVSLLMAIFIIPYILFSQDLPTKRILDVLIDGSDLWIAGDAGVIKYDKITGKQIIYNPFTGEFPYSKTALKLAKDLEENIWATSAHHGIAKFNKEIWRCYNEKQGDFPSDQWNYVIIIDKENNKWIGNYMFLVKSDNEKWEKWIPETMECEYSSQPFITAMALDHDEVLWIGGYSNACGSFGKFTGNGFEFYNTEYPDWIVHVNSIAIDPKNNVWIGMSWNGLSKYNRQQFTTYTTENSGIPSNDIYDVKVDKEGNLWFACGVYLVKFDEKSFAKYEHPDIQSFIHCIAIEDNGDIWLGTHDDGLFLFSNGEFQQMDFGTVSIDENDKPAKDEAFTIFADASEIVIDFSLSESAQVSLSIFDMQGKEVGNILKDNNLISGKHQYSWNHIRFSSGIYLVRYIVNSTVHVKKVIIP